MVDSNGQHIEQFRESLEDWTDERFISRQQLEALAMFSMYLVNLSEDDGWQYDGHSFKIGEPMCCLTVKATRGGLPQVVFTSGRTYTGCIVAFVRKVREGWLEWRDDRYRL